MSEEWTICSLDSDGTNFIPPSRNTEQLLQIEIIYVFDSYHILIYTYNSLFEVDNNHNSFLTNKYQLKFKKSVNHICCTYPILAINHLHGLHVQSPHLHNFTFALKISSDEESFIAMCTFCRGWLQYLTRYLRLTLVFMWNSTQRKGFNFYFSRVFFLLLTKLSWWRGDWALGYHAMKFRQFHAVIIS